MEQTRVRKREEKKINLWHGLKDFNYKEFFHKAKNIPLIYLYKNLTTVILIIISIIYLLGINKSTSLSWTIFFLISFGYAIFVTAFWKKDRQFNIYLSLILLLLTFALFGFTLLNLTVKKIVDFKLIYHLYNLLT